MSQKLFKYIIFFLAVSILPLLAQGKGKIRGIVSDSTNGEILPFCNVFLEELNIGASTDNNGYFVITSIPANRKYTLLITYVGYKSKQIEVFVAKSKITELNIRLNPASVLLHTIEKIGERIVEENAPDIGLDRITIQQMESIPKGVETDIFRSLQYIAGVNTTGDISARYNVRGGSNNQNLVLLDNVTIYNPFHAFGLFSVIDPEMINGIEFFKGGFPAEDGGRLSSIMRITTKEGNKFNFGGKASASFLTAKVFVEGPIPYGSFYVSGRRSHTREILKKFLNGKEAPFDFYDFAFRVSYRNTDPGFIDDSKWTISGFFSNDETDSDNPFRENFKWKNNLLSLRRFQVYESPLYSELNVSVSNFEGEVLPKLSAARAKRNVVNDFTVRMDFNYIFDSRDELGVGVSFKTIRTKLFFINPTGAETNISDFGGNISIYTKYKFLSNKKFGLDLGTRLNLEGLKSGGNFFFEPRINFTYRPWKPFAIKGAWGLYQQGITTITDETEVVSLFEPWFLTPEYLTPARAIHFNLGLSTEFIGNLKIDVEAYYKIMRHLPEINRDKKFSDDPDLVEASGESYGLEFTLKYLYDRFRFTSSYSLSYAYKSIDGWVYYPGYDQRHALRTLIEINLGKGWYFNTSWIYNSGRPFTPSVGYYDRLQYDDLGLGYYDPINSYKPFLILGDRNIHRLPDYHRLDFSITKKFVLYGVKFTTDISVINAYDRNNIFYFERDTGRRVNMLPILPTATIKMEI